jgi:hypothetical protein
MDERWRHRALAPVYALAITFVLVLVAGVALASPPRHDPAPAQPEPAAPPPPRPSAHVRFTLAESGAGQRNTTTGNPQPSKADTQRGSMSGEPAQLRVRVEAPEGSRRTAPPADQPGQLTLPLEQSDGLSLLVGEGARVCVILPEDWSVDGARLDVASRAYCQQVGPPARNFEFVLRKGS